MKKTILSLFATLIALGSHAQLLDQHTLSRWNIPAANYSGITPLGNNEYAIVSDKEPLDGFYRWRIVQNDFSGDISFVTNLGFFGTAPQGYNAQAMSTRDAEGIIYNPQSNTVFISGEGDQRIIEHDLKGQRTGRELQVPAQFENIWENYGFEALAYDTLRRSYWTMTENTLHLDGTPATADDRHPSLLRLLRFGADLQPAEQYAYELPAPQSKKNGRDLIHGVAGMTVLPDGRLVVLEREAFINTNYMNSRVWNTLYIVDPSREKPIQASTKIDEAARHYMHKRMLTQWTTEFKLMDNSFSNYEGICMGRPTADGRQTLLLICDSQNGYGVGPLSLRDRIRVFIMPEE